MRPGERGFNLIELMVVVAVLGVIFSIAIPNYYAMKARALEASVEANMYNFQIAIIHYSIEHHGIYPTPGEDLEIRLGMPGDQYPENPFSDVREPWVWGPPGGPSGTIGNQAPPGGYQDGYIVWGMGRAGQLPLLLHAQ